MSERSEALFHRYVRQAVRVEIERECEARGIACAVSTGDLARSVDFEWTPETPRDSVIATARFWAGYVVDQSDGHGFRFAVRSVGAQAVEVSWTVRG